MCILGKPQSIEYKHAWTFQLTGGEDNYTEEMQTSQKGQTYLLEPLNYTLEKQTLQWTGGED